VEFAQLNRVSVLGLIPIVMGEQDVTSGLLAIAVFVAWALPGNTLPPVAADVMDLRPAPG